MKKGNMPGLRIIALLLLIATLITSMPRTALPVFSVNAEDDTVSVVITKEQEPVTGFTLYDDEKVVLNAVGTNVEGMDCIWQILDPQDSNRWIDIRGAVGDTLIVSYSLVGSMLSDKGEAVIRAAAREQDTVYASEPVTVQVSFRVEEPVPLVLGAGTATESSRLFTAARAADESDTHTIVINYLFDNNAIAFEPYGASVAKGSDFSAKIPSPTVVGYAPFRRVGEDYVEAKEVVLDIKNIQEDITINVIYEPALVKFSVHHHLQNLLDDDYSIHYDLITTGQALTGTLVPEGLALTEVQLPGFKSLAYERLPVAADGSTVVEIRYDRNYYLVDFDNNGGYGAEPVYTRYGATVGADTPTRHGYVFGGWELVSYGGEPPTAEQASKYELSDGKTILVPDANLRYRARWITQETTYTLVFWKENANDSGYSYWGYLDGVAAMSGSYVSGEDRIAEVAGINDERYFTFNAAKTEKNVLVEGDGSTVVNVYYTRNYYSITFKAPGLCTIPENHTHGDGCYDVICDLGHVHSEECDPQLICTVPEHTAHTEECITCGVPEHTHGSADCDCKLPEHTHTKNCWNNIGDPSTPTNAPKDVEDGEIYRNRYTYIYIKGTWYRYSSWGASTGDIVDPVCGYETEHAHGTNCACDKQAHTHDNACYSDSLHTHDVDCYSYSCGEDLHTHDAACLRLKCAITEGHTHSTNCKNSTKTNTVKVVNRKYQQSIEDLWPVTDDNGVVYDGGQRWEPSGSSYYSLVLVFLSKMVPDNFTLTLNSGNYDPYTMNYYIQVLPGDPYTHTFDGYHYVLKNTIKAKYNYVTKAEDFFDITGFKQYDSDPGFSNDQIDINSGDMTVDFFYNRLDDLVLEFNNNGTVMDDQTVRDIMYEAPLKQYEFEPEYPDNLEPNAYAFAGWYTSPGCFAGTEVDWDTLTMPEDGMLLYAKWEPIRHTVRVFKDATMTEQIGADQDVAHNGFANAPAGTVVNGNYIFQGWFYMDEEDGKPVEKAFTFNGIPVRTDLDIYAKWSSHVSVDYTIRYVLDQTGEPVADPTYGSAIAGNNKTFEAKAGDDLYAPFRTGYYPLTNSHTITMSVDGTHEFTFRYVYVEAMPYIVRYVNAETGETVLTEKKVTDNSLSVVTETFARVDRMMPDAYQKRLVLSASGEDADGDGVLDNNVITFYYHSDDVHSYYQVVHYIANISGDAYREYRSEEMIGLIGQSYTVEALTLTGFTFNGSLTKINGENAPIEGTAITRKLGADGMLIELYYDRNDVEYTVKYLEAETGKELHPAKTSGGIFGQQVLEYAVDLKNKGYQLISDDLKILSLSANPAHNVIEFMYQEAFVSVKYQIVGPAGCGSLSQSSENVLAISGQPNGSMPTAAEGFLFEGWYLDPGCTQPVDSAIVDAGNSQLKPVKAEGTIWKDGTTYYAKFLAKDSDLTIRTTGTAAVDSPQAFLFCITGVAGTDTEGVDLTVSIIGDGSVTVKDLPVGKYTVVELTEWSWRYENATAETQITLSYDASVNVLVYDNIREAVQWLDGNDVSTNIFGE